MEKDKIWGYTIVHLYMDSRDIVFAGLYITRLGATTILLKGLNSRTLGLQGLQRVDISAHVLDDSHASLPAQSFCPEIDLQALFILSIKLKIT